MGNPTANKRTSSPFLAKDRSRARYDWLSTVAPGAPREHPIRYREAIPFQRNAWNVVRACVE